MLAISSKASEMPIFLEEQGTWIATLSLTLFHSSLSMRKDLMNSTGSYKENLQQQKDRQAPAIAAASFSLMGLQGHIPAACSKLPQDLSSQ